MAYLYKANIKSNIKEMDNLIEKILIEFEGKLDESLLFDLRLILSELIINAMDHGNSWDESKFVFVSIVLRDKKELEIEVSDQGKGIKEEISKKKELSSSGRGLVIVRNLVDEMSIKNSIVECRIKLWCDIITS